MTPLKHSAGMQVKLWGTRGSLPAPFPPSELEAQVQGLFHRFFDEGHHSKGEVADFLAALPRHLWGGYGGETPCIQVSSLEGTVVIDGGSGIRPLGHELMKGPCGKGSGEVHILFTHFHWDHLMGLPFFTPIFIPGNRIHVYAVQPQLKDAFKTVFKKPYFPVQIEQLGAEIE